MEEWSERLAAMTAPERQEAARVLLAELTGQASSADTPKHTVAEETPGIVPARTAAEPETDSAASDKETAPAGEMGRPSPAAEATAAAEPDAGFPAAAPEVLVTKRPDGGVTLRRRAFPAQDTEADGETELSLPTRQESAIPAYDRMREVSDFFRRDTRRYDPGYTRY